MSLENSYTLLLESYFISYVYSSLGGPSKTNVFQPLIWPMTFLISGFGPAFTATYTFPSLPFSISLSLDDFCSSYALDNTFLQEAFPDPSCHPQAELDVSPCISVVLRALSQLLHLTTPL